MAMVGVRELKNNLSRYLRLIRKGERVVVTQRGVAVAVLSSPTRADAAKMSLADKLKQMADDGLLQLGDGTRFPRRIKAVKARGRPISDDVIEDRR